MNMNLVEATKRSPHLRCEGKIRGSPQTKKEMTHAKENSHHARCSANCCIDRASGGCLRTPPHPSEEPGGGLGANAKQQCLCRTRLSCRVRFQGRAVVLDEFGQWLLGGWLLI